MNMFEPAGGGLGAGNLFADVIAPTGGETFQTLMDRGAMRIERIISSGHPEDILYLQPRDEWVCLLQGSAELWIDGESVALEAGDYCFIPAGTPHRVVRTSSDPPSLWLAVHWGRIEDQAEDEDEVSGAARGP